MRPITCAALLGLFATTPALAQYPLFWGPAPGGYFVVPGRGFGPYHHYRGYAAPSITIVINQAPTVVVAGGIPPELARFVSRLPQVPPENEREILANAGRPEPLPPPKPKVKANPNPVVPPALLAPPAAADKGEESDRQAALGRESFASGRYGRAAEQFQKAVEAAPDRAIPHFLLAQAQVATGRYREAVVSILAGLKLKPDWPAKAFNPRDLYGQNIADFALDLDQLRAAAERSPAEPALSFLYGYELWLNGRRDEAKKLFERALPATADPTPIRLFLDTAAQAAK
jgi:tetratricopeptide (TPR) repeat protein